jgi:protein lifeguard
LVRNDKFGDKFGLQEDRMNFVRKVYGILGVQLVFTALFTLIPVYSDSFHIWMINNIAFVIAAFIGEIVTSIALICCRGLSRSVPTNYILLTIFTVCEAYLVGFISARYDPEVVLAAAFMTAGITAGVSWYAWTTKSDFTICGPLFFVLGITLLLVSMFILIFGIAFGHWRVLHMIFCGIAVVLFSFYLIFDTQLIMGGKRYEIEIDDYILGAIILYTDIITIFLYLLRIFGGK